MITIHNWISTLIYKHNLKKKNNKNNDNNKNNSYISQYQDEEKVLFIQ